MRYGPERGVGVALPYCTSEENGVEEQQDTVSVSLVGWAGLSGGQR